MSYQNANYSAFYVSEPFSESNLGANSTHDFVYYNMLRMWKGEDNSFPFNDAHDKTYNVRDGSDWEKTLKPRLHTRLDNSKNIILFLSSITANSRALREEMNYGIGTKTYVAKFNIPEMMKCAVTEVSYQTLPKFTADARDLSVICDDEIPVAELETEIKGAVGKILEKVTLFDVYKGEQIEKGKKSVSYSITMRSHDGTLTDEQADSAMKKVLKALSAIGAELRM